MQANNKITKFRETGFKCTHCHSTFMIGGEEPMPSVCTSCGLPALVKTWDQTVTTTVTIESHPIK